MASLWPDLADNFAERILKIKCKKEDGNKKCEMCGIKSVKEWNYKLIRKRVLLMMIGRVQREREREIQSKWVRKIWVKTVIWLVKTWK